MFHRPAILSLSAMLSIALAACNQNAESAPSETASSVPSTAQSREDVEKIIRAYMLENPEIIIEALDVLADRETIEISKDLASDPRDPRIGADDAPVTIVEFFDYNCGYCKSSLDWVMEQADSGNVQVIMKELPILSEQSRQAAFAAVAAKKQGKYLELHQKMMRQAGNTLTDERIEELAREIGLNVTRLRKDMESAETLDYIQDVRDEARKYGANATPAFFVNGELISGFNKPRLESRIAEIVADN